VSFYGEGRKGIGDLVSNDLMAWITISIISTASQS